MLVSKMTVEEMASQLLNDAPAIDRLGIPSYNWWNEALHGVARAGTATVFPQAIGMAATFNVPLVQNIANVIAEEGRAKYNTALAQGDRDIYKGLTFWAPNINIFRDPRWGRGQETYGEDPYLTSRMGVAFIKGLQQGHGKNLKAAACAKHFACHSGPEEGRHSFDCLVSAKDLEETYLPAFKAAVCEGKVEAVMGAYNALNGVPCCANELLLNKKLREEWGFEGHVVSDCGAIADIVSGHRVVASGAEAAALALSSGCDLNCGCTYEHLLEAIRKKLIDEETIRRACVRLFTARFKLGMFDDHCEFDSVPFEIVECSRHKRLALKAAEESIVLLKNNGLLPLDKKKIRSLAVIGPNADSEIALYGNYNGDSEDYVTDLRGIRAEAGKSVRVFYSKGSHLYKEASPQCKKGDLFAEAVKIAQISDIVLLSVGYDSSVEGEEGDANNFFAAGDRTNLLLPSIQRDLIEKILNVGKPTILVMHSGGGIDISAYENRTDAIIQAWYSGERGGEALAKILFGRTSPSGKLPVSIYRDSYPLPDITDYSMCGRTYRYLREEPLYPFGFGLSYSKFRYSDVKAEASVKGISGTLTIENVGKIDAETVLQGYVRCEEELFEKPLFSLCFFVKKKIKKGQKKKLSFLIKTQQLQNVDRNGERVICDGKYKFFIGGHAPDSRSFALDQQSIFCISFEVCHGEIKLKDIKEIYASEEKLC